MKKLISLFLSVVLITLVACSTGTDTAKVEIIPEGTELSGVLEISALWEKSEVIGWWPLTQGFMELHPNVEIVMNDNMANIDDSNEVMNTAINSYLSNLGVRIASGDTPDLIFDASGIVEVAGLSGMIYDLNEFMDSDPEYVREDYFENVIEAHELDGKLYQYPLIFNYDVFRFREDVMQELNIDLESLKGVDYKFLFDTFEEIKESGKFPEIEYLGREGREGKMFFNPNEELTCFDNETLEINFDTPEFINFLKITMAYESGPEEHGYFYVDGPESLFETNSHFAEGLSMNKIEISKVMADEKNVTQAVPVVTSQGSLPIYSKTVAIPQNAKNPELAWEFIKYCIEESEEISGDYGLIGKHNGDRFDNIIPINKNNFQTYYRQSFVGLPQEVEDEFIERMLKDLENDIAADVIDNGIIKSVVSISYDYYNGLMSAEECAREIQERAEIYMGENS